MRVASHTRQGMYDAGEVVAINDYCLCLFLFRLERAKLGRLAPKGEAFVITSRSTAVEPLRKNGECVIESMLGDNKARCESFDQGAKPRTAGPSSRRADDGLGNPGIRVFGPSRSVITLHGTARKKGNVLFSDHMREQDYPHPAVRQFDPRSYYCRVRNIVPSRIFERFMNNHFLNGVTAFASENPVKELGTELIEPVAEVIIGHRLDDQRAAYRGNARVVRNDRADVEAMLDRPTVVNQVVGSEHGFM